MRARIDTRSGSWPVFWTLGSAPRIGWPANGEIDIMEFYRGTVLANFGYQLDGKIKWLANRKPLDELEGKTSTPHLGPLPGRGGEGENNSWSKQFHVWTMDWNERKIDLLLDGQLLNHLELADADNADRGNPFRRPVYFILNQAVGGDNGGEPASNAFPIRFEVDWVRVYQRTN